MEVRVLGPLEVVDGDRSLPIGGGRQRKLLAILLLHANEFVPSDRLIDELWGDDRPDTAVKALQGYVSQLRKTLGADALVTRPGGYLLELAPGQLDLHRFEQLVDGAREAEPRGAAERLREALALWRGPPLADFTYDDFAQGEIARLEERRLVALERRIEADLALGRHQEVAGELAALVKQHPLRERLRAELMLALYRSGRQAEALEAFADARRTLLDELGLEPSEELQQLQAAILAHDSALGPSPRTVWPRARRMISRPRFLGALGAILLLSAIGAAALLILGDSGDTALAQAEPDSVASGRMVGAEEALAMGLVNRVVPAESLREEAIAWAAQLAAGPPLAVARIKRAVQESLDRDLESMLAIELENQLACFDSQDVKRGLFAFLSKDTPRFEGN